MHCNIQIVNLETGEVYYSRQIGYAFNLSLPDDVGLKTVMKAVESTIRGSRLKQEPLQCRLMFSELIETPSLPFQKQEYESPEKVQPF